MEIRRNPAFAHLQDSLLACAGASSDWLPLLLGNDSAFFLVPSDERPFVVPAAILQPTDLRRAEEILSYAGVRTCRAYDGRLWVTPSGSEEAIARLISGSGTRLVESLPMDEIQGRLPADGLVRGWLNPPQFAGLLRQAGRDAPAGASSLFAAVLAAELDAIRYVAFRRDIQNGDVLGEGIAAYDLSAVPEEVARMLNPQALRPGLVGDFYSKPGYPLIAAFRPETQAWIPWLRYLAAHDRRGPLRNLDFWLDEFQERCGVDLANDVFATIGDRGWFLVLNREHRIDAAVVLELHRDFDLERPLTRMVSWMREQLLLGRFGGVELVFSRENYGADAFFRTLIRTPVHSIDGPGVAVTKGHLVIANSPEAFRAAAAWIDRLRQSEIPGEAHGLLVAECSELARLLESILFPDADGMCRCAVKAVVSALSQVGLLRAEVNYEEDAIRFRGRIR
jgi:hypothetical protein